MKVAIACGGTGGHLFPGLAVAEVMKDRGHSVELWLSGRDVEKMSLSGWEGGLVVVGSAGFPSGMSLRWISAGLKMLRALLSCIRIMKRNPPDVILGMGGYASVGPVFSGYLLGVPVVLHEANVIPGRAVVFLSRFADVVITSFAETRAYLRGKSVLNAGFPVRGVITGAKKGRVRLPDVFTILVMGGSQGAHRVNEIVSDAFVLLNGRGVKFHVIHLSGGKDEEWLRGKYSKANVSTEVLGFLNDMNRAYAGADIAISRAGAASCAELAICGLPAVLVPLPSSMRGHQLANAMALSRTGSADVMQEPEMSPETLADYLEGCINDPSKLARMKQSMRNRAIPDAASQIADLLEGVRKD